MLREKAESGRQEYVINLYAIYNFRYLKENELVKKKRVVKEMCNVMKGDQSIYMHKGA